MAVLTRPEKLVGDVLIRTAVPGEEEVILDLLSEAAAWIIGLGIEQWPARFAAESVRVRIEAGQALLVGDPPVATLVVADEDEFWGDDPEPAYYVSRLTVSRSARGLGATLLDWVSGKAVEHGRHAVRLATASGNPGLRRYYEAAGFRHVADPPRARWPISLYERKVNPTTGSNRG
ncbi:GNAT family N-acetyltransferase [Saccharothrix violaceirubra]|uniref:GNAT superfamily N-acetyltransferase n=1 Tax=Saccharothrix violaceirubra TaxID=413306 RepID=A0A7W7T0W4_9PSEU|nr:GNAT family N-acetyltransferase [Saccharothrix violaceirubra]MBB4964514.1 GNAT superfamily N-acetyltransferase [Saccharothrix violaceirubra]